MGDFRPSPGAPSLKRGRNAEEEGPREIQPCVPPDLHNSCAIASSPVAAPEVQQHSFQDNGQFTSLPTDGLGQFPVHDSLDLGNDLALGSYHQLFEAVNGFSTDVNRSWNILRESPPDDSLGSYFAPELYTAPLPPLTPNSEYRLPAPPLDSSDIQNDTTIWSNTPNLYRYVSTIVARSS